MKYHYTNGDVEYSHIIHVESDCLTQGLRVFPNPTKRVVNVVSANPIGFIELIHNLSQVLEHIIINKQEQI